MVQLKSQMKLQPIFQPSKNVIFTLFLEQQDLVYTEAIIHLIIKGELLQASKTNIAAKATSSKIYEKHRMQDLSQW